MEGLGSLSWRGEVWSSGCGRRCGVRKGGQSACGSRAKNEKKDVPQKTDNEDRFSNSCGFTEISLHAKLRGDVDVDVMPRRRESGRFTESMNVVRPSPSVSLPSTCLYLCTDFSGVLAPELSDHLRWRISPSRGKTGSRPKRKWRGIRDVRTLLITVWMCGCCRFISSQGHKHCCCWTEQRLRNTADCSYRMCVCLCGLRRYTRASGTLVRRFSCSIC